MLAQISQKIVKAKYVDKKSYKEMKPYLSELL